MNEATTAYHESACAKMVPSKYTTKILADVRYMETRANKTQHNISPCGTSRGKQVEKKLRSQDRPHTAARAIGCQSGLQEATQAQRWGP